MRQTIQHAIKRPLKSMEVGKGFHSRANTKSDPELAKDERSSDASAASPM